MDDAQRDQLIEDLSNECATLRLWVRALMYSHPLPGAFADAVEKERQGALAEFVPEGVSDAAVDAIHEAADKALLIARLLEARARGIP